ncbi:unnamed protein product [Dovyalis caffra]|uniref:Uncharacterized protein n=1 Tax=Dovyalis caffra TaxID=77055 RepID=A0AAV1R256_9ROSI|nr:unnamed protein product [Dovyalis caffra]
MRVASTSLSSKEVYEYVVHVLNLKGKILWRAQYSTYGLINTGWGPGSRRGAPTKPNNIPKRLLATGSGPDVRLEQSMTTNQAFSWTNSEIMTSEQGWKKKQEEEEDRGLAGKFNTVTEA